jgi:hypothetical protein
MPASTLAGPGEYGLERVFATGSAACVQQPTGNEHVSYLHITALGGTVLEMKRMSLHALYNPPYQECSYVIVCVV